MVSDNTAAEGLIGTERYAERALHTRQTSSDISRRAKLYRKKKLSLFFDLMRVTLT
jgi:hypothetical protein